MSKEDASYLALMLNSFAKGVISITASVSGAMLLMGLNVSLEFALGVLLLGLSLNLK